MKKYSNFNNIYISKRFYFLKKILNNLKIFLNYIQIYMLFLKTTINIQMFVFFNNL